MRLTLEKILVLKNVPLFAGVPEPALSDFIAASEEIAAMEGTDIIRTGEMWSHLYIILQGQVRLHRDGRTVSEFSNYGVLGELSALDPAPSAVTVTAVEDTTMFRISGDALYRLMNEHKSIERSVISSLCRQLRQMRNEKVS